MTYRHSHSAEKRVIENTARIKQCGILDPVSSKIVPLPQTLRRLPKLFDAYSNFSNGCSHALQKCIDRQSDGPFGCSRWVSVEPQYGHSAPLSSPLVVTLGSSRLICSIQTPGGPPCPVRSPSRWTTAGSRRVRGLRPQRLRPPRLHPRCPRSASYGPDSRCRSTS